MHFHRSSKNHHFILNQTLNYVLCSAVSLHLHRLLENTSTIVADDTCRNLKWGFCEVVGSYNILLCVLFHGSISATQNKYCFRLWNPATRTISRELGFLIDHKLRPAGSMKFSFCRDYLTGDYKVVAFRVELNEDKESEDFLVSKMRVLSLGGDCWKEIESFPLLPLIRNNGVHLNGTVNWLVIPGYSLSKFFGKGNKDYDPDDDKYVIVSLDLSMETYTRFLLPTGFDDSSWIEPSLRVLMDCLCYSRDFERTGFVIWQMKEFGVQDSWTRLFRIEYLNLQMHNLKQNLDDDDIFTTYDTTKLLPLHLSKNGDTLILTSDEEEGVIIYNRRDKRVERTTISNDICWFSAIDYIESLVSTP